MTKKSKAKTENIHIRMTPKNKNRLKKEAKKQGMNMTEYIEFILEEGIGKCDSKSSDYINGGKVIVAYYELVNFIVENYSIDRAYLEKEADLLWDTIVKR